MPGKKSHYTFEQAQLAKKPAFSNVTYKSKAYERDLQLLVGLQNDLKTHLKSETNQKELIAYKDQLQEFYDYLKNNRQPMTEEEQEACSAITKGHFTTSVKKRLFEDHVHRVKKRITLSRYDQDQKKLFDREIAQYERQPPSLIRWLQITYYAYKYDTLTLLGHYFKERSLAIIRHKAHEWQHILEYHLRYFIEEDFERFTNEEYNFLRLVVDIRKPLDTLRDIHPQEVYSTKPLSRHFDEFARIYLKFADHKQLGQSIIKKAFVGREIPKGLVGVMRDFQENPFFQVLSHRELHTNTITGALYAFYTSREKKLVTSFAKLVYVTATDTSIDSQFKHLTENALKFEQKKLDQLHREERDILNQFEEIKRVTEAPVKGRNLMQAIFRKEQDTFPSRRDFYMNRPLLLRRILDYFFDYFGYALLDSEANFSVSYQGKIYQGLLYSWREIHATIEELFQTYQLLSKFNWQNSHYRRDVKLDILQVITKMIYTIGRIINDIMKEYEKFSFGHQEITKTEEFLSKGVIEGPIAEKLSRALGVGTLSFRQFLENIQAVAYYIADLLEHPSFMQLNKEKKKLQELYEKIELKIDVKINPEKYTERDLAKVEKDNKELRRQIEKLQFDELTKLPNRHYLNNQIIPKNYKDSLYQGEKPRYVFFCDIDHFKKFNDTYGHELGDKVLHSVAETMQRNICADSLDKNNVVVRVGGEEIMGYINSISIDDAVSLLDKTTTELKDMRIRYQGLAVTPITMSVGIYQEHKATRQNYNMHIADLLMYFVKASGRNNIAYLKDEKKIVTPTDLDDAGHINPDIIRLFRN